eukprot:Em0011g432a
MFYLDDGTLGGALTGVLHDLQLITKEAYSLVQQLNYGKSEIISNNSTIIQAMLIAVPELQVTDPRCTTLLGTPLGDIASIQCKNRFDVFGAELKDLGHPLHQTTGDSQSTSSYSSAFLWQSRERIPHPSWEH